MQLTISFGTVVTGFLFGLGLWVAQALVNGIIKLLSR